ncbi:MAG: hypothetical protein K9K65_05365 [Desulfarculaceae bacterium]|nr:hypothetical protein [Desulfarculaceae bacterium]MCF8047058.1 hypothetical protein [Desulfarculaceae bacterium]MCF8066630.1 hypothetical protein [Desulfarculaceae bacterium]MCF8097252.1 hypothetical protein [Desulfarculaceae bacterium]MCF8122145.1 hypothetical protein [Desulfarculaceae bacterium]
MVRKLALGGMVAALLSLLPAGAWAGGGAATELVVVADTRALSSFNFYLATLYNQDMWLFATWAVVITSALGVSLGLLMDLIMSHVGLDLGKSAGHVEH